MATVHLHRDDVPDTLALLNALLGDRTHPAPGYAPDETGADVDWARLADGYLSTSEKAVVHIANGSSVLKRQGGGLPIELRWQVLAAVKSTTEG